MEVETTNPNYEPPDAFDMDCAINDYIIKKIDARVSKDKQE